MACQYPVKGKPEIFGGASELLRESLWGLLSTKHSVLCISGAQRKGVVGDSDKTPFAQVVQRKNFFVSWTFIQI